ncbi:IS66 family insertion sequence element accessory protein TnpB, partial [Burkholderia pseudomallei]|uniref:IS66 family insertion sequence element accessory protein TnpB n=4 Tax=Burkholderia pseudomallei TaxID=28450 RepID=UPI0011C4CC15
MAALIRIDAIWLATEPVDMRAGVDTLLARVVKVFGAVRSHHAYLFANRHSTRMKGAVTLAEYVHKGRGRDLHVSCGRRILGDL